MTGPDHPPDGPPASSGDSAPRVAAWLGYGGLIPFVGSLALCYFGDPGAQRLGIHAMATYAAVILSFIGGIHWGIATQVRGRQTVAWYVASIMPSLIGWAALLLTPPATLGILLLCFTGWYVYERSMPIGQTFPAWFVRLRLHLTSGAVAALVLGWLRTLSVPA